MMQVKKYRATTTREALEQIKRDLGEDAFVLETKQVRTGGIFGFGSGTQIEVSAVAASAPGKPAEKKKTKPAAAQKSSLLGLVADEPAEPILFSKNHDAGTNDDLPAFDFRGLNEKIRQNKSNNSTKDAPDTETENQNVGVEISEHAPRIVYPKKESKETSALAPPTNFAKPAISALLNPVEPKPATQFNYELERLRAELREVKFTLSTFASRHSIGQSQSNVAFDAPIELYDSPFYEAYLELTATGLVPEMVRDMVCEMIPCGGAEMSPNELAHSALLKSLPSLIKFAPDPLRQNDEQKIIALIGSTGVGKTTTLAKLAARVALRERRRVELVTLDTYRIAAVEQLKTYAEIIGAGCHVARSILELDAILTRMPDEATILIDTTGRSPHDLADQFELSEYLNQREDILKCLVIQATTHYFDATVAARKFAMYGANCLAITKLDETTRAGAAVQVAADTALPLIYLCAGQRVPEDLEQATPESFAAYIMPSNNSNVRL